MMECIPLANVIFAPVNVARFETLDFSGCHFRQLGDDFDAARVLPLSDLIYHVFLEGFGKPVVVHGRL
jgi:hypothetical protein